MPVSQSKYSPFMVSAGRSFDTRAPRALRMSGQRIEPLHAGTRASYDHFKQDFSIQNLCAIVKGLSQKIRP